MGDFWDSFAPVGNWLKGGTAPWWAALLTFYLGQRFSLRGAKEQRDADAVAREAERKHALTIVAAEHDAAAARAKAEVDAAAEAAEAEALRAANATVVERAERALDRAIEATANLRASIAGLQHNHLVPVDVLQEFYAASSARGTVSYPLTPDTQAAVRKFANWVRDVSLTDHESAEVDEALLAYQQALNERQSNLWTTDDQV